MIKLVFLAVALLWVGMVECVFNSENSDEFDPEEAKIVYRTRRAERNIPPSCGLTVPSCDEQTLYRRIDGSCNNLEEPTWGVPNSTYLRLLPALYGDKKRTPRRGVNNLALPSARKVRTALFPTGQKQNTLWPIIQMQWGQFVAHDMSLLRNPDMPIKCCDSSGMPPTSYGRFCYPIKIPLDDATMGKSGLQCMNFSRTMTDVDIGCAPKTQPAEQLNVVTSWLDLSNVYGNDDELSNQLRTLSGGRLKTEVRNSIVYPPRETDKNACPCQLQSEKACYKTGDSRANQNPQLAITQIVFVREHNRLAKELASINPHWKDEQLFQEARRILIATYQHITYYEWLPIFFGTKNLEADKVNFPETGYVDDYDSSVEPGISNEHAHAGMRFFHTHIVGNLQLLDANRKEKSKSPISTWWNRPQVLETGDKINQLTLGMLTQNMEETDNLFVSDITEKQFACRGIGFGIDLRATDFQRDRDHGLRYYNDYRKFCGLKAAKSFNDYGDLISQANINKLKQLYKNFLDVDVSVGGSLEKLVTGAQAGPTFKCLMMDQFRRTRQADRFWYEHPEAGFTPEQLDEIRKSTVSRLFCDNGDGVKRNQKRGFILEFKGFNEVVDCNEIPSMDLINWADFNEKK